MAEYRIVKYRDTKGVLRTKRVKVASTASNKAEKEESKIAWQNNAGKTVKSQYKASNLSDALKTYSRNNNNQYKNIYGQSSSQAKTIKVNLSTPTLKENGYNTLLENLEKSKDKKRNEGKIAWQKSSGQYDTLSYNDRVKIYLDNQAAIERENKQKIEEAQKEFDALNETAQRADINRANSELAAARLLYSAAEQNSEMTGSQQAKEIAEEHMQNAETINNNLQNLEKARKNVQTAKAQEEIDVDAYNAQIAALRMTADNDSEKYITVGANNNRFSNISEEQQNYLRENYDTDKSFKENVDASAGDMSRWGKNIEYITNNEAVLWSLMTDDQKDTYNYILGHDGERAASDYMDQIEPFLAQQYGDMADKAVDEYYKDEPLGEVQAVIAKGTTSFATGVQSHVKGLINAGAQIMGEEGFGDNFLDWSYQGFSRNAEGIEKTLYDLGYQSGNMLPSILTGNIAGGVAGSVLMGISASGNAYNQALSEGYSVNDARLYGVVIGISETVMERALGGISGLAVKGGLADTIANKAVAGIKNIIKNPKANYVTSKIVGYLAGNSGEFVEEYLQECFEPIYRNILFNEDNEVNFFTQEAFEAGFMGYLMAGVNNAVVMSGNNIKVLNEAGEMRNIEGGLEGLIESGIESPRGTLSSKMAHYLQQKILSGEKVSNFEVSMLIEGNKQAIADEEIISEYINGTQQFKNISREGQTALLNPDNIEVNNNRYGINIPENAAPKQIAEYLKGLNAENKANYLKENEVRYTDAQLNKSVSKYYENVENVTGKKIYVKSMAENIEGYIDGDRIVLNSNMAGTVQQANWVLAHELTHSTENTETYKELENMALESIEDIDAAVKAKQELYEKNGHPITRETALQELVAEYAQKTIFADTDGITEIIRRNGNVAQRIYQFIVDKINYFKSLTNMTAAERKQYSELKSAQRIWEKALREGNTIQRNERIKYSITKNFSKQVDDVLNGKHPVNDHVYMGETPKVLQEIGFAALPMLTTQKHIKTITNDSGKMKANYHGLGAEMVKQLPKAIEDPIMIVKSKTHPDTSVVVVTELLDKQNRPVIASVLFDGKGVMNSVRVDSNIMTSAYGKDNSENLFKNIFKSADNFYYANIKKSLAFADVLGLQLPNKINKTGFYNSIRKNNENINNFDKNNIIKYSLIGNKDGKDVFISNFPPNTPKAEKSKRIVELVQRVWQYNPIKLTIYKDGFASEITAKFDPTMGERTDLSKIAFGNRKGTMREQKLTLNLADDLYYIAENSKYVSSKAETGKNNPAHKDVTEWHYFINDIIYREVDKNGNVQEYPYRMNIDVKEKADGNYFYSFGLEKIKDTRPEDVLSSVTAQESSDGISKDSIRKNDENINNFDKKDTRKFSINPKFESEYNHWAENTVNKRQTGEYFVLGITSKALKSVGLKDTSIIIDQSKIVRILNKHPEITDDIVKQIPQLLEYPILIMESKTDKSSVTVLGEVYGTNGVPVMAALKFRNVGARNNLEDYSVVKSAYARGKDNSIKSTQNLINSSKLLYIDQNKNRTDNWLVTLGLQLPVHITTYGPIDRLSYTDNAVNNNIRQNDKKDTRKLSISDNTEDVTAKIKSIFSGKNGRKAAEHFNRVVNPAIREINEFMPQIRTGVRKNLKSYAAAVLESDMTAYKEIAVLEKRYRGKAREAAAVIERINKGYILSDGDKATALDISNGKNVNIAEYGDKAEALQEYAQALKDERYIDEESEKILKRAFDKQKKLSKNIFNDLYENAVAEDTMDLEVKKDILDRLKHKMYVSKSVKAELGDDYHPRMHGFNLTGNVNANISANAIDSNYYDLSKAYPQYFPQDIINPADQLKRMFEIKDNITTPNLMREVYGEEYRVAAMQEFTDFYNKIKRAGARAATINEITIPQNLKESQYYEAPSVSFLENKLDYDAMTIEDMRNKKKAATSVLKQLDNMYGFTASEKSMAIKIADNRMSADNIPDGMDRQAILSYAEAYRTRLATQMAEERRKVLTDKALKRLKDLKKLSHEKGLSDADKSDILDILGKYDYVSKSMTEKGEFDTRRIADEYRAILEEHPNAAITKSVEDKLSRLDKIRLNEMSADDIYTLIQDISALEYTVRHMNSVLGSERQEGISETANEALKAVESSKGFKGTTNTFIKYIRNKTKIDWIRPQTFFEQITGYEAIGRELYEMLSEGTIKKAKFKNEALSLFGEFNTQNKSFIEKMSGKKAEWIKIDVGGKQYEITPAMRISLYLHSKNDGNLRHFSEAVSEVKGEDGKIHLEMRMGQGITIPDKKYYEKGMKSEAYIHGDTVQITRDELKTILDNMTETEKTFGDIAYKYFNETSKKAINETSNLLEGISAAQVENYFPLQSDPNKLRQGMDVKAQAEALANIDVTSKGFLKERQNARNAIILDDVTSILLNQIEAVSDYYGYAVAHRNFEAILSDPVIRDNENGYSDTLEEVITKQYGREAMDYVKKMLEDNIGINKPDKSFWGALQGRFASAVLGANPSVVIKQLSAYPAAGAVIGQQSLVKGLFRDTTFTPAQVRALDETIGRYTPMLGIRKEGTGVREIGDVLKNNPAWAQKAPVLMQLSGIVDTAVIRKLWGACESYVEDTMGMYKNEKPLDNVENREVADNKHQSTEMTFEEAIGSGEFIRKSGMERSKFKQFVLFLKRNLKNKTSHERFELFKASNEEIEAFAKAGFDISGKVHTVRANALYHMDKRRGGQSELIENRINRNINLISDYEAIPYVIKNAQSVYLNRNQKGENRGILYEYKDNNGMVYYVESIANGDYLDGIQFMKLGNDVSDNPYKNVVNSEPIYTRGADANIITANTTEAGNSVTTPGYYARNVPSDGNITQQKNKSNKKYVSEDEYYKAVAKVFNECIFATQQNYTPMQRSQILRRTDPLSKLLTLFSSQNNQNYNILYEAAGRYKAYKSKYGKNSEQFKQAKQQLGRAATSYILQNITFAGLGVFIKGTIKGGYDDEEEGVQYFLSQLIGAFAGTVYFGNELYDLIMSGINGRDWEGINIAVFGMIQDLGNNISDLIQAIANISNTGTTNNNVLQSIRAVSKLVAQIFGVPAENAESYIKDIVGRITEAASGGEFSFEKWYDGIFYKNGVSDIKEAKENEVKQIATDVQYSSMSTVYDKAGGKEIIRLTQIFKNDEDHNINDIYLMSPPARRTYNSKDYILTGSEKDMWTAKQNGALKQLNDYVESDEYKALTDEQKFEAVSVYVENAQKTADRWLASEHNEKQDDIYMTINKNGSNISDYATYEALTYDANKVEDERYSEKDKKQILSEMDISEESMAGIYKSVFESKDTKQEESISSAIKNGVSAKTYIEYEAKEFKGENKSLQKKNWILNHCETDKEIQEMYSRFVESTGTDYYNSIDYAVKQGVSAKKYVQFKMAVENAHGTKEDESTPYVYWRSGQLVTEEVYQTESGSVAAEIYDELLDGGYSDKEIEVLYSMQYSNDAKYPYIMQSGISAKEYVRYKKLLQDVEGGTGKKQRVLQMINTLNLSASKKRIIAMLCSGYALGTNDYYDVIQYINNLNLSASEKYKLAEKMGLAVENGRVYARKAS